MGSWLLWNQPRPHTRAQRRTLAALAGEASGGRGWAAGEFGRCWTHITAGWIHLYPLALVKKHLPTLSSGSLVPNCVPTIIQWRGQRWMVGTRGAIIRLEHPDPRWGRGMKIFQGFIGTEGSKRVNFHDNFQETFHWHVSYSPLPLSHTSFFHYIKNGFISQGANTKQKVHSNWVIRGEFNRGNNLQRCRWGKENYKGQCRLWAGGALSRARGERSF